MTDEPSKTDIELAKCVKALADTVTVSLRAQAASFRLLAKSFPDQSKQWESAASGLDISASNLSKYLPDTIGL